MFRDTDFYKKKILNHYNLIDSIVQKRFPEPAVSDEAFLFVMERLEKDNWRRVREYKGDAMFTTYISKVVINLLLDFSDHKYGKFYPPLWIKKMGALWEEVHKRLCRERMSKKDVEYSMTIGTDRDPAAIREAIEVILAKIPDCGKFRKGKMLITDPDDFKNREPLQTVGTYTVPLEINPAIKNFSLLETLFSFLDRNNQNTGADPPEDKKFKTAIQSFHSQLKLSAEERLFLKMIYQDGFKIKAAGEKLNIDEKQVHKRHKQLLEHIRKAIRASGLEQELKGLISED